MNPVRRVACIGKFTAMHRGHRALVDAAAAQGAPVVVRFSGMDVALGWQPRIPLLTPAGRSRVLDAWSRAVGVAIASLELPFARIRALDAGAFLDLLRDQHGIDAVVCGPDFRCGRSRSAGVAELAALSRARSMRLEVVGPVLDRGRVISSSRIRTAVCRGRVAAAARMLDRPHELVGRVIHGEGRGHGLGFPTANLGHCATLAPATGTYAARALLGARRIAAAVNVGRNPTIGRGRALSIEAHLIDWSGDCYGADIRLQLLCRLRGERRFPDHAALSAQIAADVTAVREVVGSDAPV
ncbi:MAG: riboflavin kinase [Planctomycetota bacterium]